MEFHPFWVDSGASPQQVGYHVMVAPRCCDQQGVFCPGEKGMFAEFSRLDVDVQWDALRNRVRVRVRVSSIAVGCLRLDGHVF